MSTLQTDRRTEWQKRRDTLMIAISCTQEDIRTRSKDPASANKRRGYVIQTLDDLLTCLGSFGNAHFNYFHDEVFFGLTVEHEGIATDYPPEHVLSVILDQISFDLEAIEQAANQRLSHNSQVYDALEVADEIARRALKPALTQFQLAGTRLVTYFQKSASIRVIPYASVALIGIPYTATNVKRDFLAIPHEVAHYLYWHGKINGRTIQQELTERVPKEPKWCYEWLEEIFADVYGCLIAGPTIALSFQDLQLRRTPQQFVENDKEHPTPILRPNIYTKILKRYFSTWGDALDIRWNGGRKQEGKRQKRSPKNEFNHSENPGEPVGAAISTEAAVNDRAAANKPIDKVIANILAVLSEGYVHNELVDETSWWQAYLGQVMSIDELYLAFSNHIKDLTKKLASNDAVADDGLLICTPFETLRPQWLELGQQARKRAKAPQPPEWLPVLHAGGWATRGPECEGSGTCGGG